jgi:putative aldouronate transport system permease protein
MIFTRRGKEAAKETAQIYSLLAPLIIYLFIFCYIPMYGVIIAFQNYFPGSPFIGKGVQWVGLKWVLRFIRGEYFWRLIKNTLVLSGLNLAFGFTIPILFALLVDQIRRRNFRKFVQTASYLPYFISMVVVGGMVLSFINIDGIITQFLTVFGLPAQNLRLNSNAFPIVYTVTNVWKGFGFGSILYLSTITSIDPGLYESARIDGANRFQQVIHITLPGIQRIIAINLIMAIGGILGSNTELILHLSHPATYQPADVIGTNTSRRGIVGGEFSYTTAVGLFMSIFAFILTYSANKVSNKLTDFGLW